MSQFTSYSSNPTAQLQASLIRSALAMAGYRMRRASDEARWHIRQNSMQTQGFCTLAYDGWGKGIGKWWSLSEAAPQRVLNVIETCVTEPQVTSRGGSEP